MPMSAASDKPLPVPTPGAAAYPLPVLAFRPAPGWRVPDEAACHALWDSYAMPAHIRAHSNLVACVAASVARMGVAAGVDTDVATVYASGLLHDIAKDYTIRHGGNHAQLGAAWTVHETGNPLIAQGVLHHVRWPWDTLDVDAFFLPLVILYADKRVMHDTFVGINDRFDDLVERYGRTDIIRQRIRETQQQANTIEHALSQRIGTDLHACTFDCGRLVQRT